MNQAEPERFFDYPGLSKFMGVSKRTIRNWVDDGRLRATHLGPKSVRFDPADVRAFIAKAKTPS